MRLEALRRLQLKPLVAHGWLPTHPRLPPACSCARGSPRVAHGRTRGPPTPALTGDPLPPPPPLSSSCQVLPASPGHTEDPSSAQKSLPRPRRDSMGKSARLCHKLGVPSAPPVPSVSISLLEHGLSPCLRLGPQKQTRTRVWEASLGGDPRRRPQRNRKQGHGKGMSQLRAERLRPAGPREDGTEHARELAGRVCPQVPSTWVGGFPRTTSGTSPAPPAG